MDQPPSLHAEPPANAGTGKKGCFGCVGILLLVIAAFVAIPYVVLFHSPLPVKWAAREVAENTRMDSSTLDLSGVGGSISKGVSVKEITFHGQDGDSTIEGFKFHFNGLIDSIRNKRLIIEELSTERAEFVVGSDFFSSMREAEEETEEDPSERDETNPRSDGKPGEGLQRFELQQLRLENTRFRSVDGEIDIEIPLVRLAGLRVEGDDFELGELEVVSEGLNLELVDASPEEISGQRIPFSREVRGTILPSFHPLLRKDLPFRFRLGAIEGKTASHIILADGAIEQTAVPEGESLVRFASLTLADYIDTENHVLPERFTTTVREVDRKVDIGKGEFFLGKTRFEIAEQQVDPENPESAIVGTAEVTGHRIAARVRPEKEQIWPPLSVELESTPTREDAELLSLVYFQQAYAELAPEEKARIDGLASSRVDAE